jgi:hypothetical protein
MLRMGFEPMNSVFEWAETFRALDSAATMIDLLASYIRKIYTFGT